MSASLLPMLAIAVTSRCIVYDAYCGRKVCASPAVPERFAEAGPGARIGAFASLPAEEEIRAGAARGRVVTLAARSGFCPGPRWGSAAAPTLALGRAMRPPG